MATLHYTGTAATREAIPAAVIGNITPFARFDNEELLKLVLHAPEPNPLMMELALRLEQLMDENEELTAQVAE